MTGYLLDTNVISELKRARPDDRVSAFIAGEPLDRLFLSVVTFAEICFDIELLADAGRRSDLWRCAQPIPMSQWHGDRLA